MEPAFSEWAAPVLLAPKKDSRPRFSVEYCKPKTITKMDNYALLQMDECIESFGKATIFTTLDAYAGYWHILVRKED